MKLSDIILFIEEALMNIETHGPRPPRYSPELEQRILEEAFKYCHATEDPKLLRACIQRAYHHLFEI